MSLMNYRSLKSTLLEILVAIFVLGGWCAIPQPSYAQEAQPVAVAEPEAVTSQLASISNIEVTEGEDTIRVVLNGTEPLTYNVTQMEFPLRLVIDVEGARLDAAAETARLYLICLANQSRLINAEKTMDLAKKTVFAVKKRVAAGKTPDAELSRARAEAARRELVHEDVEHELSSAIHLLAAQWGDVDPVFTRVEGSLSTLPVITSFEVL